MNRHHPQILSPHTGDRENSRRTLPVLPAKGSQVPTGLAHLCAVTALLSNGGPWQMLRVIAQTSQDFVRGPHTALIHALHSVFHPFV